MECSKCGHYSADEKANFCSNCGEPFAREQEEPCIGVSKERGIFQITFAPVEGEFENEEGANNAVRHSCWNNGETFQDYNIIKVRSTVTKDTHPYICGSCGFLVSEQTKGKCDDCGAEDWVERVNNT